MLLWFRGPSYRTGVSGQAMSKLDSFVRTIYRFRWGIASLVGAGAFVALAWWLRHTPYAADRLLHGYLEIVGVLLAFTYAANALVRFRGTHDRISLILAFGFVLSGLIEMASSLAMAGSIATESTVPLAWMVGRTLLAAILVAALAAEHGLSGSRESGREVGAALLVVGGLAYVIAVLFLGAPREPVVRPGVLVPRPWDLIPAGLFAAATVGYWKRLKHAGTAFDKAICAAVAVNVLCHLIASQSQNPLDAPFAFAQGLKVTSYAILLGGALLDNARLFDKVRQMAVSDSLTGLSNYRRLVDVLEAEARRSERTGRTFAVLLLDLDGLKKINDQLGHVVGTRAICRVADVLRGHCRAIDVAARYGGDEFALVLPESGAGAAWQVACRICERLESDGEEPRLAVSLGVAVYPNDGQKIESLLAAADRVLYDMKGRRDKTAAIRSLAAIS